MCLAFVYEIKKNQSKDFPDWFLWLYGKGPVIFLFGGVLLFGGIIVFAWYLDYRIDQIEGRLTYVPPASYQEPDLDDYDAQGVQADQLPVRQLVYVPVYSHVYFQAGSPYSLETTLSVRNTDPNMAIYVESITYYNTSGKLAKTYLDRTIKLAPLQTIEYLVERRDSSGGSGANFMVAWAGDDQVQKPLIETVMVGANGTQGISFGRTGIEISEKKRNDSK